MLRAEIHAKRRDIELSVEFAVADGHCLALAGPSGAGKTSVLRAVCGLLRPRAGRIALGSGVWFDSVTRRDLRPEQRRCGVVFQDYALFPHMPAWRNVAYGLPDVPRARRRDRALDLLERLGVGAIADARPAELSGGERQRVAVARALACDPRVLLLDEPLAALDRASADAACRELSTVLRDAAIPCLLVTHDFAQASLLADEVAVMDRGTIVQAGRAADLAAQPASAFVAQLTGATVLSGQAQPLAGGTSIVTLSGGAKVVALGSARGPASVVIHPWDVTLGPVGGAQALSSARNHVRAHVGGIVPLGDRVRVALELPEPLIAEITAASARELALTPGSDVTAIWKATSGRVIAASTRPQHQGTTKGDRNG